MLEVIVSRTNFISSHTELGVRIVGLSTALANARDLADWLGITNVGLYNFRPSVRPVPIEIHISGYPGKHYCPRMATMNKPAFQGIKQHSPTKVWVRKFLFFLLLLKIMLESKNSVSFYEPLFSLSLSSFRVEDKLE